MTYNELSQSAKRNLKYCKCSICSEPILETDSIQYLKYRVGRRMIYSFFHTNCLSKARTNVERI